MTKNIVLIILSIIFITTSSFVAPRDIDKEFGRDHNVCKKLQGDVLLYLIWVESKNTSPWTQFDMETTLDSIQTAVKWIQKKANENQIKLKFVYNHATNDSSDVIFQRVNIDIPIVIDEKDGLMQIDKWTDRVIKQHSGQKTKFAFFSKMRNEYKCESVALLFITNNYYKEDYIYSFNTTSNDNIEYSVISTKRPNLIAQNILNLFGAPYLYHHPSTANKGVTNRLQRIFANDIMANISGNIQNMEIGSVTKYFIGWSEYLNDEYERMVKEKSKI